MADPLVVVRQGLLVGLGAIPGAWLRLRVMNHFEPVVPRKHWGTLVVNLVAAFGLGLVAGLVAPGDGQPPTAPAPTAVASTANGPLLLLIATGFFGSLSTFSTFAVELLNTLRERQWLEGVVLALGSILGGLLVAAAGYALGSA
ncbi:MAG: fluoride efflux transporter FluC [Synechococcus sp.]